jgi:serine/threonine protein kinase
MVGQTFSHYEVVEELGHGGMGAVYKARDIRLNRVLALKVLRADLANPVRERRFIQEAKAASSLNHPNIVTIYEIFHLGEFPCIAMEYVTGETLEKHFKSGPLELRQGLDWAVAIADALATAHGTGIVHRDIKPSNIMITGSGLVKILDFGLAKLTEVSEESQAAGLTQEGRIVGTPPYLSPEQAKAEKVDARSDIFAFGVVMYEMFTGKRPFERETNVEMLSAVVRDDPKHPRSIKKDLPKSLEAIIERCLQKKVERRYQSMAEVREALEEVRHSETLTRLLATRSTPPGWRSWKFWGPAGLLAIVVSAGALWWVSPWREAPLSAPVLTRITADEGLTTDPALSPDGKFLAYASDRGGQALDIWIQPAAGGEAVRLTNHPADDREPVFSPDGGTIAFRSERDGGGLYAISILGGQERLIASKGRRPRFSPDGQRIAYWIGFSTGDPTSPGSTKIFVVPAHGGTPVQLVPQFEAALYPVWSPDGKHVLFLGAGGADALSAGGTLTGANRPVDRIDWWITPVDGGKVMQTGVHAELLKQGLSVWASSGAGIAPEVWLAGENQVLFSASRGSTNTFRDTVNIWSVPLSSRNWRVAGPARQLTSGTAIESRPAALNARDVLFASAEVKTGIWKLPVAANEGRITGELKEMTKGAAFHGQPAAALNGSKLVYYATKSGNMDIWIMDLQSGNESQLTFSPIGESAPQISADGATVYYSIYGKRQAYLIGSRGGEAALVCDDCGTWEVSHDGTKILYWYSTAKPVVSIGMLQLLTGEKCELISHPQYSLYQPHFSPDNRWIAFLAKTGQDRSQIFVTPFKGAVRHDTDSWIPITDGESSDDKPRWSPDGRLIYFTSERDGFRCIWAQHVNPANKHVVGNPFAVHHFHTSRRSLMNVGLGPLEISVTRDALFFNLGEIRSNVWRASRD